jgi:hypothetical protein
MNKNRWTEEEVSFLKNNHQNMSCFDIAKKLGRTNKSVQHKYNQLGLTKRRAQLGDVIKGWKIVKVYTIHDGRQNVSMANIESIIDDQKRTLKLSLLTNRLIAYPDRKRPDLTTRNTTHGMSRTRLHAIWSGMITRCSNSKQISYRSYGGRGIKVCENWKDFNNFKNWAIANGYQSNLTLDRIDVNGDYCPENCRWANRIQQTINKRNTQHTYIEAFGETKHIIEWAHDERCKVSKTCLEYRINTGWEPEKAITQQPERRAKKNIKNWLKDNYPKIYQEYNSTV